ncbi:MAG: hypothetical protein KGJ55_00560 [Gammaproteobacteria bacterium]|nr:hypothetical protein [Gammaproteobacteria bacterium]
MNRRPGLLLAVAAVLLQTGQPLFATMAPATARPGTLSSQRCHGTAAAPYAAQRPIADRVEAVQPAALHLGGSHADGCCCQGPWNCGGPCGLLALGAGSPVLAVPDPAHIWPLPTSARPAAAHLQELLKPPIDS